MIFEWEPSKQVFVVIYFCFLFSFLSSIFFGSSVYVGNRDTYDVLQTWHNIVPLEPEVSMVLYFVYMCNICNLPDSLTVWQENYGVLKNLDFVCISKMAI